MRIEKDAEWNRLEGRVGQLEGDLRVANEKLDAHAAKVIAEQLGVIPGKTLVQKGADIFQVVRVEPRHYSPWVYGAKIKKDGNPSEREQCLYDNWRKIEP